MAKLSPATGREVVRALQRAGRILRRTTGSHFILRHPDTARTVVVPCHSRDLKIGTLRAILREAGITTVRFRELLG